MIELNWKTVRFIVVGVLCALVYFIASYLFLTYTELPAFIASLLAYACSFGFAYLGQKFWAFRCIAPHSVTLFRYAVLQACCATFAATFTQAFVSYTNVSPLLLSGLATVLTSGTSYIVSSCWVFADASEQEAETNISADLAFSSIRPVMSIQHHWRSMLLISAWLLLCIVYINLYYYMPWSVNLYSGHDDGLFIRLANSLAVGDWLGTYSQYTLMKGPGYPFFLVLTHFVGISLYSLTAIFHCLAVSFFAWTLFRLSQSRILVVLLFVLLLFLPLVISSGRIIRDQIYPDQFLLGFSALLFSLFVATSNMQRICSALLAGVMFAWLWLTREEGVWILPSIAVLTIFAVWKYWRNNTLKQGLISSVFVLILSFSSIHITFQLMNWRVYGQYVGVDIKEQNFKAALAALQSVRVEEAISHVPVTDATMQEIYQVSPGFAELQDFFATTGLNWRKLGCWFYPWACNEIAGGWFIWALREAVASKGYYKTPAKAAAFYAKVAQEINQACADKRLSCSKSLTAFMPEISQRDIKNIPDTLQQLIDMLLLSHFSANNMRLHSEIDGSFSGKQSVLNFLHSQERFYLDNKDVEVFGRYAIVNKKIQELDFQITDKQGKTYAHTLRQLSGIADVNKFYPFSLQTSCLNGCRLAISIDGLDKINAVIPDRDQSFKQEQAIELGNLLVFFDQLESGKRQITGIVGAGEIRTLKLRQRLFEMFKIIFPVMLVLGLIAFVVLSVIAIKQRSLSTLFIFSAAMWGAVLARLTILFLVHISSFPALAKLYFMPVYSILIISSLLSLYLLIQFLAGYLQNRNIT